MKTNVSALAAATGFLCAGCFSLSTATTNTLKEAQHPGFSGHPIEHVVASNYGWYLFNVIPLACGRAEGQGLPFVFFRDDVTADKIQNRLSRYAANRNANLAELNLYVNDTVLFEMPGTSIPIPLPYVICYKEYVISSLLIDKVADEPEKPPVPAPVPPVASAPAPEQVSATPEQPPAEPALRETRDKNDIKMLLENIPDGGVR